MSTIKILILAALSFFGALLATPWAREISIKYGLIDKPNKRKIHESPIPYGGGIAIFIGFVLALLFLNRTSTALAGFTIGSFIIIILGLFDDKLDLAATPKFIFQALAALVVIYAGIQIDMSLVLRGRFEQYSYLAVPLTFFWIIGITNAINLIDGLDGLAAGVSTISAFTISVVAFQNGQTTVAVLALIVGFAALGFLPHNFNQDTRVFMGDSGSMFLGFSLAVLSIMGSVKLAAAFSLFVPVMILAIPIFDTLFAIGRRIINRRPIYEGDSKHFHHRLLEMGFTPLQTVISIYLLSIVFSAMAIYSATVPARVGYVIFLASITLVFVVGWVVVYFHHKKTGKTQE